MKTIVLLVGLMFITFSGCEESSYYLHPYCNDGIRNGNETGVDCGGDCIRCWECGHYCQMIAGDLPAEPGYNTPDHPGYQKWTCFPPKYYIENGVVWETYYFYNTGRFMRIGMYNWSGEDALDTTYGYWTFDNPQKPQEIGFYSKAKPKSLDVYHYSQIVFLGPDSLIFEGNAMVSDPQDGYYLLVKEN